MNRVFDEISRIQQLIAASFVNEDGLLLGSCRNSGISEENLLFISKVCLSLMATNQGEQRMAHTGSVAFGDRTLIFRSTAQPPGIFIAYLDSPVNEAVIEWLFAQVSPLLLSEGIDLAVAA